MNLCVSSTLFSVRWNPFIRILLSRFQVIVLYRPLNKGHLSVKDRNKFYNGVRLRGVPLFSIILTHNDNDFIKCSVY